MQYITPSQAGPTLPDQTTTILSSPLKSPLAYDTMASMTDLKEALRKVGGGYIFIHRYFMEYFASLTQKDIE